MSPNVFKQTDLIEARRVINRGKGSRAVVATRDIAKDELIERVPVILIPRNQVFGDNPIAKRSARISWYVFDWIPTKRDYVALCLGYGSLYNHSHDANAVYEKQLPDIMCFIARRDIAAGEEITIDYRGGDSESDDLLGFEVDTHDAKPLG
jgi:hypothetical protein